MIVEMDGLAGMMPALGVLSVIAILCAGTRVSFLAYVPRRVAERNATRFPTPDFPGFQKIYIMYLYYYFKADRSVNPIGFTSLSCFPSDSLIYIITNNSLN